MSDDKRLPFQDTPELNQEQTDREQFWEHIAELLEQIEENTRGGVGRRAPTAAATLARPKEEARSGKKHAGGSGTAQSNAAIRTTARTAPAERRPSRSIIPSQPAPQEKPSSSSAPDGHPTVKTPFPAEKRIGKKAGDGSGGGVSPVTSPKPKDAGNVSNAPTKSQEALAQKREESLVQKQAKGILGALKQNLATWDGSVASSDKSDIQDAAGLAAGGPLWSAFKELKETISESDETDDSLAGVLKKTIAQKTGLTAAKERIDQATQTARAKVVTWAGGKIDAPQHANRDKQGRFIKGAGKEAKIAEKTLALASQEAREGKKRHDELVEAIKAGAQHEGRSIFGEDGLVDRMGRRRGARKTELSRSGRGRPGRRGKFGFLAGAGTALLGGASAFTGDSVGSAIDIGSAALSAPGVGKAAGAAGKALGLGAKGALGAAKAIPIAGQVLAAGMALYDGVSGWNDADMHREAFGLENGQEASTGQKASAAAANILDMGGLLTGAAGLLGFEVSTSDIAKGIFDFGDSIGSTLSGAWNGVSGFFTGEPKESEEKKSDGLFDKLASALSELTDTIDEDIKEKEKPGLIAATGGFFTSLFGGEGSQRRGSGSGRSTRSDAAATKRAQAIMGKELGALSAQYESGNLGSDAVGYDRNGGTSYGKYQIASNTGTMDDFLRWADQNGGENGKEVAARMRSAGPLNTGSKSGAAVDTWRALEQEGKLGTLEHDFIKATHFDPAFAGIQSEELRKRVEGSKALQDVLWSTSVQHGAGGAAKLINRNFKQGMSDEDFINALYADRATQFGSSTAQVQKSVHERFTDERQVALAMLQKEQGEGTQTAQSAADATPQTREAVSEEKEQTLVASAVPASIVPPYVQNVVGQEIQPQEPQRYPEPEAIRPEPVSPSQGIDFSQVVALLTQLVDVTKQNIADKERETESANAPNIPMDYDDPFCLTLAHDRA